LYKRGEEMSKVTATIEFSNGEISTTTVHDKPYSLYDKIEELENRIRQLEFINTLQERARQEVLKRGTNNG